MELHNSMISMLQEGKVFMAEDPNDIQKVQNDQMMLEIAKMGGMKEQLVDSLEQQLRELHVEEMEARAKENQQRIEKESRRESK